MKSKFLKIAGIVALGASLAACGKTETKKVQPTPEEYAAWAAENGYLKGDEALNAWAEANGYVKPQPVVNNPKLEVSFATFANADENLEHIDYASLKTKFEGGYDFLLMYGNSECSTCAALKTYLGGWVKQHHYQVYYINELTEGNAADKTWVMGKLGNPSTYPFLYAVKSTNGAESAVVDSLTFSNAAAASADRVDPFIAKNFELEDDQFQANVKKFKNLAELRAAVAAGEKFVLYVTRNSCPDCQKSADIKRDDSLTVYFKGFKGNFYEIVSEEIIAEHKGYELVNSDVTASVYGDVNSGVLDKANILKSTTNSYFNGWSDVQISEQLADAVASGAFDKATLEKTPVEFYKAAVDQLKDSVGFEAVAGAPKLGMYFTSEETTTMTLIDTEDKLAQANGETNPQYFQTKDDGTAFLRALRSTPTVVASGYASIKNVLLSNERQTIYGANGKAIGYKKIVSQTKDAPTHQLLASAPADWATNYKSYFTCAMMFGPSCYRYAAVTGDSAPTFETNKYYKSLGVAATATGYSGTNRIAFKLAQELDDSAAIGGRSSADASASINYLYWYNMNPDNITPRDNNGNACYNTPEYIARIQADIIAWANSWLIDWSASVAA